MLYYGLELATGTDITNLTVESGSTFPSGQSSVGRLYFNTTSGLNVYTGTGWTALGGTTVVTGVSSFNSRTGIVSLTTADVIAVLPVATTTTVGGISVGSGLQVNQIGAVSVNSTIATTASVTAAIAAAVAGITTIPAGTIIAFTGTVAPSGYIACPSVATNISRTTYANLFSAIGTTWGVGDGSTTFGMPWFPVGYTAVHNPTGIGTNTIGQLLAHSHTLPGVNDAGNGTSLSGGGFLVQDGGSGQGTSTVGGTANLAASVGVLMCVKI